MIGPVNDCLRAMHDRKLEEGREDGGPPYAALMLAAVGLERLGWHDKIHLRLDPSERGIPPCRTVALQPLFHSVVHVDCVQ